MTCNLLSKDRKETYVDIRSLVIPVTSGKAEILPGHAEFIALLRMGEIIAKISDGSTVSIHVQSGFCRVDHQNDIVTLLI